jgi:hypothetical protein
MVTVTQRQSVQRFGVERVPAGRGLEVRERHGLVALCRKPGRADEGEGDDDGQTAIHRTPQLRQSTREPL